MLSPAAHTPGVVPTVLFSEIAGVLAAWTVTVAASVAVTWLMGPALYAVQVAVLTVVTLIIAWMLGQQDRVSAPGVNE